MIKLADLDLKLPSKCANLAGVLEIWLISSNITHRQMIIILHTEISIPIKLGTLIWSCLGSSFGLIYTEVDLSQYRKFVNEAVLIVRLLT